MDIYSVIILCFIPLITVFLLLKILVNGISVVKKLMACLIGLISLIPITVLQFFCGEVILFKNNIMFSLLFRAIILYGLIEEGIKGGALFLFPAKKVNGKLMYCYSMLAGLFLGSFESVIYVLHAIQNATNSRGEILFHMIFLRSFTAIVIHTFCSALLGLFVYGVKNKNVMVGAVINAVLLHGIYDFFAIMNPPFNWFSYAAIGLLLIQNRIYYIRIKKLDEESGKI